MGRTGEEEGIALRGISYDPLPSQRKFHELKEMFKGFSGPIGSGKSQALCQEAIRRSYLNPGRLGLIGAPTYPMLRDATQVALLGILDENEVPYEHNRGENTLLFKETGSRVLFRPVEEFERLRGTNLAWFGVDELTYTHESAWLRLQGRLRDPKANHKCGFAVWTPKGFDWVYRRFIAEPPADHGVVRAQPFENRHLSGDSGDFYERLKSSYDQKFYEQEVLGLYLNMDGGRVYSAFEADVHVKETPVSTYLPLLWALDFNVNPMSSVVAQRSDEAMWVVDEIYLRDGTTQAACEAFVDRHGNHRAGVVVYGDAAGKHRKTSGVSDFEIVQEYLRTYSDLTVTTKLQDANPQVKERVNLVNRQLRNMAGKVTLTVNRNCRELIKDLNEVCYKAETSEIDKNRDRMRTHLSDALGYLVWQEYQERPTGGPRNIRLILS